MFFIDMASSIKNKLRNPSLIEACRQSLFHSNMKSASQTLLASVFPRRRLGKEEAFGPPRPWQNFWAQGYVAPLQESPNKLPRGQKTHVLQMYYRNSLPYSTSVLISNLFRSPSHTINSATHQAVRYHMCMTAGLWVSRKNLITGKPI